MIKRMMAVLAGMFVLLGLTAAPASADLAAAGEIAIAPSVNVAVANDDQHTKVVPAVDACDTVPTGTAMSADNQTAKDVAFYREAPCNNTTLIAVVPAGALLAFAPATHWQEFSL